METTLATADTETTKGTISSISYAEWLRRIGVGSVAIGALTFVAQNYSLSETLSRSYAFVLSVALLMVGGIICAAGLKEVKSARAFFGLAGGLVPALSVTLGGAVCTWYQSGTPTGGALAPLLFIGLFVIGLASFLFAILLGRPFRQDLIPFLIGSSLLLLLPQRDSLTTAVVGILLYTLWERIESKILSVHAFFTQRTGIFIRVVSALFVLIFLGRSVLYNMPERVIVSLAFLILSRAAWYMGARYSRGLLCCLSMILASFAVTVWVDDLVSVVPLSHWTIVAVSSVIITRAVEISSGRSSASVHSLQVFFLLSAGLGDLLEPGVGGAVAALTLFAVCFRPIWLLRSTPLFIINELLLATAIVVVVRRSIDFQGLSLWCSLLSSGVLLITAASLYERYGTFLTFAIAPFSSAQHDGDTMHGEIVNYYID